MNHHLSLFAQNLVIFFRYSLDQNKTYSLKDIKSNLLAFGMVLGKRRASHDPGFMEYLANTAHENNITNIMLKVILLILVSRENALVLVTNKYKIILFVSQGENCQFLS